MKKIIILSTAVLSILAAVSCTQETPAPDAVKTVLRVSIEPTKTALGDKVGNQYPNYWKAGDQVSVNGVTSEALGNEADGKSSVESFTFEGVVSTPYYATYPATAVSGYSAGSATITLPASQSYVAGSYDPLAYVMYGKSTVTNKVALSPVMSLVHLTVNGSGASINRIQLTSESGLPMSGSFTTDFENGLVPKTGNVSSTVEMVPASAVALPAEFFICVPAGLESTMTVKLFDTEGKAMTLRANLTSALLAGQVYSPDAFTYTGAPLASFDVTAEGVTSSTAVICLPDASYAANELTFNVYSDADCGTLVDSYAVDAGNACWGGAAPRFCISGLAAGTTYFVTVEDVTNTSISGVLPVTTRAFTNVEVSSTPAAVNDVILAEDFGELRWDSELITSGVGYFATSQDNFSNSEVSSFLPIDTNSEKTLGSQTTALGASRLEHWAQGANNNLYIHPGYIKLVGNKKVTHLVTPALDNIPDGKLATLEVEVTACPYYSESSAAYATMNAIVAVQPAGSLNELRDDPNTNTLDLSTNIQPITLDAETAWKTYKVTLTGVGKGARLAFGAAADVTENSARMNISDMKVTLKALEDISLTASVKAVSSSTAAFTWTYGGSAADDIAKPYTYALYRDSACTDLVLSLESAADASRWDGKSPCFVFGGLNPDTDYWFVATDTASSVSSDPVCAHTEAFTVVDATLVSNAAVGDVILAEDFSEISQTPDELAVASGFVPSVHNLLPAPSGVNPEGSCVKYSDTGNRIFGSGWDISSSRMAKGWGFFGNSSCYSRNGYLRVGASGGRTHIVTPALSGIPAGKLATIEVTVTATKYGDPIQIAVFAEKGLELNTQTDPNNASFRKYTGASLSDGHAFDITTTKVWDTKSVTITDVDSDCQLLIGSLESYTDPSDSKKKNRFYFNDIKVQITALADDPVMKIKDDATFNAFVSAVATDKTIPGSVTQSFTVSAATADAFASIEDYAGTLNGNGKTITGLTKPLFNDLKGTVKDLTLNSTLNITADQLNLGILANVLSGTADGCTSQGSVYFNVAGGVSGEHHIGGLIGKAAASGATITDCTNEATVTNDTASASGNGDELMVGGVVALFWGSQFTISDCTNTGDVTNNAYWNKDISVAGIIGQSGNGDGSGCTLEVSDCTNSGTITNNGDCDAGTNVGGIVGWGRYGTFSGNTNDGEIYNNGDASNNHIGGLIGYIHRYGTLDGNTNNGDVSNSGVAGTANYVGGLLGRAQLNNTFKDNTNKGVVYNDGDATSYQYIGGIVGYLDKNNAISDAGSSAKYKLTNSGDIENAGSAKNICIGGLFGRNSSGYFNMTGTSSKYSTNSGSITDSSGPAKSNGGDISIGGLAGYTTTGIKTQYFRNSGSISVTGDKGNTSVNVGGIGGWISNNAFNFNNCRNTGDITVSCTTTASIWVAGIVGCPMNNSTQHYYWYMNATIDTHAANVGGENYTAGLMGVPQDYKDKNGNIVNPDLFKMTGHKLAGTIWGSKTTTGLFCCTKTNSFSLEIKWGDETHPCTIAPGTIRKDNVHNDTINDISDVNIDVLAGGAGSTYDPSSAISSGYLVVADW